MKLFDCRRVTKQSFITERGFQPINSLFCILEGEFTYTADGKSTRAGKGDVLLFPDNVYFERRMLSPMTFYYARFSLSEDDPPYTQILRAECRDRLLEDFVMMERLSNLLSPSAVLADHYLADIFASLATERLAESEERDPIVGRALLYFREQLSAPISLAETARICGVSQSLLSLKFRTSLGCSPIARLSSMRIERAKELLCERDLPIAEVGALCGYENPYYFSNAFLKQTGMRPKDYRRQFRI